MLENEDFESERKSFYGRPLIDMEGLMCLHRKWLKEAIEKRHYARALMQHAEDHWDFIESLRG